ncbi:MAG: hypothetical protein VCA18_09950 [Opitutales bacterium]
MNKSLWLTPLVAFLPFGSIVAKPLNLEQVADDANWLMHVDFDSARASSIGSFIMDEIESKSEAVERMAEAKASYGVDPKGFSSLTMFGNGEHKKGIAIMSGGLDPEKMTAFARKNDTFETIRSGKDEIHSLNQDKRHPMAFATLKNDVIVGGPDADYVRQGIKLANGTGASRGPIALLGDLRQIIGNPGFIAYVDVAKASAHHDLDRHGMGMAKKMKSMGMVVGEADGLLKMVAIVVAEDEETAAQMEGMANGMMAMAALGKDSKHRLANLLKSQSVTRTGNTVTLQVGLAIDVIEDHIEKEMRKRI